MRIQSAADYPAPRENPLNYPGRRPGWSFVIRGATVHPITFSAPRGEANTVGLRSARVLLDTDGDSISLDGFLADLCITPIERRFAVIGYGSNPVPGQLLSKFGPDAIIPVVLGSSENYELVYNLISNRGCAFAELLPKSHGGRANLAVTFLDDRQMHEMIQTEENYRVAYSSTDVLLENGQRLPGGEGGVVYVFAGFRKQWVPHRYREPVGIAELPARDRSIPELTQEETLQLVIDEFELRNHGISTPPQLCARIRDEASLPEDPPKLKYHIQRRVSEDPLSLAPLVDRVSVLSSTPRRTFGDI